MNHVFWDAPPGAVPGAPLRKTHLRMIKTYGLDKIAVITVTGAPLDRQEYVEEIIRKAAGPDALTSTGNRQVDEQWVLVAPVGDVAELAKRLDIGQAMAVDQKNRTFTLRIDESKLPSMRDVFEAKTRSRREQYGDAPGMPDRVAPVTDPNDPSFFQQNLAVLRSDNGFDREKALKRLVMADTSKLNDPEMHKQIAQAIRAVAFDERAMPDERKLAIRGLVHWGGKFAGPILVQLLQSDPAFVDDEIYTQLAVVKEPTAIDVLVGKLMEPGFASEKAARCLVAYGPVAEDSILSKTRAEDPMRTRLIVQVLAEIGTKKSLPALKSLRRSRFANLIAGDLQRAIQMIEQREKGSVWEGGQTLKDKIAIASR